MFTMKFDDSMLQRKLTQLERTQLPYAVAVALTRTGQDLKRHETELIETRLDRPTPFIRKAVYLRPATKSVPEAIVWYKDKSNRALAHLVRGGHRELKRSEMRLGHWYVPGKGATLNVYGNIPGPRIGTILSALHKTADTRQHMKKRNQATYQYFELAEKRGRLPAGVYQRVRGRARIILYYSKPPSYRQILPFFDVAGKVFRERYPVHFRQCLAEAVRSAR